MAPVERRGRRVDRGAVSLPDDRAQSLSKKDQGDPTQEGHIKFFCAKQRIISPLFSAEKPSVNSLQKQAERHCHPVPGH